MTLHSRVLLLLMLASCPALLSTVSGEARPPRGDSLHAVAPLVAEALELIDQDEPEAARERVANAEAIAGGDPAAGLELGKAYEALGRPQAALAKYFAAARFGVRAQNALAIASLDVRRLMRNVPVPPEYSSLMASGQYRLAMENAPWIPAPYWATAMQATLEGRRADALSAFGEFQAVMSITGLAQPFREWTIQAEQIRDQIGKIESEFLVEAGFLDAAWKQRLRDGDREQIVQIFGTIEPELWKLSEEAMRYAYRFKTLVVGHAQADYPSIQSAIDALISAGGGGRIVVQAGTYRESLVMREAARIVIQAADPRGAIVQSVPGQPGLTIDGGSRIVIDGLRFDATSSDEALLVRGGRKITFKHVAITGGSTAALRLSDTGDVLFWRGSITGPGLAARFERSFDTTVAGTRLASNAAWGIDVVQGDLLLTRTAMDFKEGGILVRGAGGGPCQADCRVSLDSGSLESGSRNAIAALGRSRLGITGTRISGQFHAGVYARDATVRIENALIEAERGDAIAIERGTARIIGNRVFAKRVGIDIAASHDALIDANMVHDAEIGIQAKEAIVRLLNNVVTDSTASGMYVYRPTGVWTVSGNRISSSGVGITVELSSGTSDKDRCAGAPRARIANNIVTFNGKGIVLGTAGNTRAGSVCVDQNTIAWNNEVGVFVLDGGPSASVARTIMASNNIGLIDNDDRVRFFASVGYGNVNGDVLPSKAPRGDVLLRVDPQFREPGEGDFRPLASELRSRGIGARAP